MSHISGCFSLFTACKRSLRRLCFYTCLSVHGGGGGVCCWGGLVRGGGLSAPGGSAMGGLLLGVSRPTPRGRDLQACTWGVSWPTPGGGLQAHIKGGVSQHALRQPPPSPRLLLWVVRILLECILVVYKYWELAWTFK